MGISSLQDLAGEWELGYIRKAGLA